MTNELRGIIEKLVSENPDIEQIATAWTPRNVGAIIWVRFPKLEDKKWANYFMEKYSDYVNNLYTSVLIYDECCTLVFSQSERLDDDTSTQLVYDKKRGIIDAV